MNQQKQKFRFLLDLGNGFEQVEPIVPDIKFSYQKEGDEAFYRHVINTELVFCKSDYRKLLSFEESCDRCDGVLVKVEICCSGEWFDYWSGYLNLNDGKWNLDKCTLAITPTLEDQYTCLLDIWDEEENILFNTPKVQADWFQGEIQCQTCTQTGVNTTFPVGFQPYAQCLPPDEGWTVVSSNYQGATLLGSSTNTYQITNGIITTQYCREFLASPATPAGSGWIPVTGGFARPLDASYAILDTTVNFTGSTLILDFYVAGYNNANIDNPLDNGIKLEDVLNIWLSKCDLEIKSNFFGINPDGNYPANTAYACALSDLQCLIIYQKTDVLFYQKQERATKWDISLEDLLECLFNTFQVKWDIIDGTFCLEHCSYFDSEQGLDLTASKKKAECLRGYNSYSYVDGAFPKYERFSWMDNVSPYFNGNDIKYGSKCTDPEEEKEYKADCWTTDLNYVINNPDEIDTDGLFVIAAVESNGSYYVDDSNNALSFTELLNCYWIYNRPQFEGTVNGETVCFETAQMLKEQAALEIPLTCEEIKNFDPQKLIRTQMGWGSIATFELSTRSCWAAISVLHAQKKCCE